MEAWSLSVALGRQCRISQEKKECGKHTSRLDDGFSVQGLLQLDCFKPSRRSGTQDELVFFWI